MTNPTITIVELDGNVIDRKMTDEEFKELKAMQSKWSAEEAVVSDKISAKAAIYAKLGLSAEEIALLV
jgi:hypothetical protein